MVYSCALGVEPTLPPVSYQSPYSETCLRERAPLGRSTSRTFHGCAFFCRRP